jgi:hypothetical protein
MTDVRKGHAPKRKQFSPVYVSGFSQFVGLCAALAAATPHVDVMFTPEESLDEIGQVGAVILALFLTFGGAGYVALKSGHANPIARTIGGYAIYVAGIGLAVLGVWLTGIDWFVPLGFLGLGLMLALTLAPAVEWQSFLRIAIPTFFGALFISFRALSEAVWSIPTLDWTITLVVPLLLTHWVLGKLEAGAIRPPQSVDPGPGPIRV